MMDQVAGSEGGDPVSGQQSGHSPEQPAQHGSERSSEAEAKAAAEALVHAKIEAAPKADVFGERPPARAMLRFIKPALLGIAIVYVVAFLLLNSDNTRINFVIFQADVPIFVPLFVMLAVGVAVSALFLWWRRLHSR